MQQAAISATRDVYPLHKLGRSIRCMVAHADSARARQVPVKQPDGTSLIGDADNGHSVVFDC